MLQNGQEGLSLKDKYKCRFMKLLYVICGLLMLWACQDETRENPPLKGNYFLRANPWKFYFVDGEGKSVLSMRPGSVLPTTDFQREDGFQQGYIPEDYLEDSRSYLYNGNSNSVGFDAGKGLYYWMTTVPGYEYVKENEFYVHFNRTDIDTVRVKFRFITEGVIGGDMWAGITEMYYNGVLVIRNDESISGEGILVRK